MRLRLILAGLAVTAAIPALAAGAELRPDAWGLMNGKVVVPTKGDADGTGSIKLWFQKAPLGTRVCWRIAVSRIGTPLKVHVHKGARGETGPVVLTLGPRYVREGCVPAGSALLTAIRLRAPTYYVDVHNAAYPRGALRGQLRY